MLAGVSVVPGDGVADVDRRRCRREPVLRDLHRLRVRPGGRCDDKCREQRQREQYEHSHSLPPLYRLSFAYPVNPGC